MPSPLRIAVIGAGAFGRNHLRVLHDLSSQSTSEDNHGVQLAAVVDADPATRAEAATRYGIPAFSTVDDLLSARLDLRAATVCVPTMSHAAVASQLLAAQLDVLVEKPLTGTLAEADDLIVLAAKHSRILAAGHLERFNPAVTAALERLTRPMFFEAHRLSVFTPRSLDVDVVLDLMIHDLDILLTMANSPVREVRAVGLPVLSRKVDIANVRLEFASGAVANLTASRVSTEQVRKLRLFQPSQYLSLDYARQELLTVNVDPTLAAGNAHPSPGLSFEKSPLARAEPLLLELDDFLTAVRTRQAPRVSGQAAREALSLALEINAAMATHARAAGLTAGTLAPLGHHPQS